MNDNKYLTLDTKLKDLQYNKCNCYNNFPTQMINATVADLELSQSSQKRRR